MIHTPRANFLPLGEVLGVARRVDAGATATRVASLVARRRLKLKLNTFPSKLSF